MFDSRCGLICTGCSWKNTCDCGGCIETMGHPFHGTCPIAICCQDKRLNHCGECDVIPCSKLFAYSFLDPEHGDKPQGTRVARCRKWAAESGCSQWRNVLLTSAGFADNAGRPKAGVVRRFLDMLGQPAPAARILFIPTAAIDAQAREMAGKCRRELLDVGIQAVNMTTYDLDGRIPIENVMSYDAVYLTGGSTSHLLRRIKETGFDVIIKKMVYANKVYVGVSAGSLVATPNIGNPFDEKTAGLSLVHAYLSVHQPEETQPRTDLPLPHMPLTDNQALAVDWSGYEILNG